MNEIGFSTFTYMVHEHWLSVFLILVSLITICTALVLRWYVRRRLREMLQHRFAEEHELDLLPPISDREQQGFESLLQSCAKRFGTCPKESFSSALMLLACVP